MADNNNNTGDHYVVANAQFTCNQGLTPAQLQVMQNQKVYVQNQLVVTDKEVTFNPPANTFGKCNLNPNTQAGQPCLYAQGQWNPMTCYQSNGVNILTESSEMMCPIGGKINCIYHGQIASVSIPQLEATEMEFTPVILKDCVVKKNTSITDQNELIFAINKIKCKERNCESATNNKKTSCKEIYVRKGESITIEANDVNVKKNTTNVTDINNYASWIVGKKRTVENVQKEKSNGNKKENGKKNVENKTSYVCDFYDKYQSPATFSFYQVKDFFVEGVGYNGSTYNKYKGQEVFELSGPTDKGAALLVHVVEKNYIKTISVDQKIEKNKRAINGGIKKVGENYYVKQGVTLKINVNTLIDYDKNQEVVHCEISQKEGTVPNDMYQYTDGDLELILKPRNAGEIYTVYFHMHRTKDGKEEEVEPISTKSISIYCYNSVKIVGKKKEWGNNNAGATTSKLRPGFTVEFNVEREDQSNDDNLSKVDWWIVGPDTKKAIFDDEELKELGLGDEKEASDDANSQKPDFENCKTICYTFHELGKYKIIADLKDTPHLRGNDCSTNQIVHEIEVKLNTVTRINVGYSSSGWEQYRYVGIKYPIKFDYDYGEATQMEEKSVRIIFDDIANGRIIGQKGMRYFQASAEKEFVLKAELNGKTVSTVPKIKVVKAEYQNWEFTDSTGQKKIDKIGWKRNDGKHYEFGIHVNVPAWAAVENSEEGRQVIVKLQTTNGDMIKDFNYNLSREGDISITGINTDDIINKLKEDGKYKNDKDVKLKFIIYNAPTSIIKDLRQTKNGGVYKDMTLTITNEFEVIKKDCYFVDGNSGKKLRDIKYYGNSVKVRLHIVNPGDKKLLLRVYENEFLYDSNVFETKNINIDKDGFTEIDIPTNDGDILEKDHSTKKTDRPRLFYFRLEEEGILSNDVLYTYPKSPLDLYNYDINKKKEQIVKNKDKNGKVMSEARSYFEQLKLMPKPKGKSKYCETYSNLVPVVLGKEEKEEKKGSTKCFCYRDFTVTEVKEILKKLKGDKWNGNLWSQSPKLDDKSIETFTREINTAFRKYSIGKCIQKIVFLAIAALETGLFECTEETKGNTKSSQSKYKGRGLLHLTGDYNKKTEMYDIPGVYDRYNKRIHDKNNNFVDKPELLAEKIHYAVDASGYYFARYKPIPGFSEQKDDTDEEKKAQKEKRKIWEKALNLTLSNASTLIETENNEDYYYLINKVLNGYPKTHIKEAPNGWDKRQEYFKLLKEAFKYNPSNCREAEHFYYPNEWHDPLDKMMSCYFSENGHKKPENAIYCIRDRYQKDKNGNFIYDANGKKIRVKHPGTDLFAKIGTDVYACMSGEIAKVTLTSGTGGKIIYLKVYDPRQIKILKQRKRNYKLIFGNPVAGEPGEQNISSDFDLSNGVIFIYMHLSEIFVETGDYVVAGQIIGKSGRTGNAPNSLGPHVHFEIRSDVTSNNSYSPVGFKYHANPAFYLYYKQYKRLKWVKNTKMVDGKKTTEITNKKIIIYNCDICTDRSLCQNCKGVELDNPETVESIDAEDVSKISYGEADLDLQRKTVIELKKK